MKTNLKLLAVLTLGGFLAWTTLAETPPPRSEESLVEKIEKEMAERPRQAFTIARQAADRLFGQDRLIKRLFATGARLQEETLETLDETQVQELAETLAKTLSDSPGADRVRRRWLKLRTDSLGPANAQGRLRVARLWFGWLNDREAAARLCKEALLQAPELDAAAQMLRHDLNYQWTDAGWTPRETGQTKNQEPPRVRPSMTAEEVRKALGAPRRISRQILYRRYLEQWTYDNPTSLWVEFVCPKGQEPYVLTVHPADSKKP